MQVKITYLGHAAFLIEGSDSKRMVIDPFITGNPVAKIKIEDLPKLDYVLVTHDHEDHLGDAVELAKRDGAKLIAIHEVAIKHASQKEGVIAEQAIGMNIGGTFTDGKLKFSMTLALHSCYNGHPAGFVIEMDNRKIYHAGDTDFFSDMKLIGQKFDKLDVALLPIGGHYTMHEEGAAQAVKALEPKLAVPMHYNTWPIISAEAEKFARLCEPIEVRTVGIGESLEI